MIPSEGESPPPITNFLMIQSENFSGERIMLASEVHEEQASWFIVLSSSNTPTSEA